MTTCNKFLHTLHLWLNSYEPHFTEQGAIPKGPESNPSTDVPKAHTLVLLSGCTSKFEG